MHPKVSLTRVAKGEGPDGLWGSYSRDVHIPTTCWRETCSQLVSSHANKHLHLLQTISCTVTYSWLYICLLDFLVCWGGSERCIFTLHHMLAYHMRTPGWPWILQSWLSDQTWIQLVPCSLESSLLVDPECGCHRTEPPSYLGRRNVPHIHWYCQSGTDGGSPVQVAGTCRMDENVLLYKKNFTTYVQLDDYSV